MQSPSPRRAAMTAFAAILLAGASAPALAADATIDQVYATAKTGDVDGALSMMAPVLKDHPNSAKAHYVEAELLSRAGRLDDARTELDKAKSIAPGLPGISSHSVHELEAKLTSPTGLVPVNGPDVRGADVAPVRHGISWGPIIFFGMIIGLVVLWFRRRAQPSYTSYNNVTPIQPGYGPGYGGGYSPGYGPGYGNAPGMGSGIIGGLAQGAAMGAGFAVGEEVVDHMFGGERRREEYDADRYDDRRQVDPDADMGGNDFGISDDSSWDSSDGGGDDSGGW